MRWTSCLSLPACFVDLFINLLLLSVCSLLNDIWSCKKHVLSISSVNTFKWYLNYGHPPLNSVRVSKCECCGDKALWCITIKIGSRSQFFPRIQPRQINPSVNVIFTLSKIKLENQLPWKELLRFVRSDLRPISSLHWHGGSPRGQESAHNIIYSPQSRHCLGTEEYNKQAIQVTRSGSSNISVTL